jgi:hypothetical protein
MYEIVLDPTELDDDALAWIIGEKLKPLSDQHCEDLRSALLLAAKLYRFDTDRRGEGRQMARRKRIAATARALKDRIASEPDLETHCVSLEQLARAAERPPPRPYELGLRQLSAVDNLVGEFMKAFEQCFGRRATVTKDTAHNKFGGRFIRFSQRALIKLQIGVLEDRTIANAMNRARHPEIAQR